MVASKRERAAKLPGFDISWRAVRPGPVLAPSAIIAAINGALRIDRCPAFFRYLRRMASVETNAASVPDGL